MSKGWTRRPSLVDREAYDAAFERIFAKNANNAADSQPNENGAVIDESGTPAPQKHSPADPSIPVEFGVHPCDVADTMTPHFHDQRSRA